MTIPLRACAPLISAIQANTTAAAIRIAAGISLGQVMETIRPDRDLDQVLVRTAVLDQTITLAVATIIIMAANRLTSSEIAPMHHFYSAQSSNLRTWPGFHGAERFCRTLIAEWNNTRVVRF